MNWFFHKLYWTGWISLHNQRKRELLGREKKADGALGVISGMALLGFTSFYREGFEVPPKLPAQIGWCGRPVRCSPRCARFRDCSGSHIHGSPALAVPEDAGSDGCDARICVAGDGGRRGAGNATRTMVADNGNSVARARDSFVDGSVVLGIPHSRDTNRPSPCGPSRVRLIHHGPAFGTVQGAS